MRPLLIVFLRLARDLQAGQALTQDALTVYTGPGDSLEADGAADPESFPQLLGRVARKDVLRSDDLAPAAP